MSRQLKDKTILISGASRGLGAAMAEKFAAEGASIALIAKTDKPNPKLPGTIHSVAERVQALGGNALPIALDIRDADGIQAAIAKTVDTFGGLDVVINNASAISLTKTSDTNMKRFDLMMQVNQRATWAFAKFATPYLEKSENPHILTMSPPLSMKPKWFKDSLAYTMSKFGMSMCTLGLAEELRGHGIAANSLWPKTTVDSAAVRNLFPPQVLEASRKPSIVADAAFGIITKPATSFTGQFLLDEDFLRSEGVEDFSEYAVNPELGRLQPDLYVD